MHCVKIVRLYIVIRSIVVTSPIAVIDTCGIVYTEAKKGEKAERTTLIASRKVKCANERNLSIGKDCVLECSLVK